MGLCNRLGMAELSNVGDAPGMTEKWRLLCRHEIDKWPLVKRFSGEEQRGSGWFVGYFFHLQDLPILPVSLLS